MAITTANSGTQSATAQHTLATDTTAGVYVCMWNLTAMANDDVVLCYVATKVLTGDTAENVFYGAYKHSLGASPIIQSPPITSMFSITMFVEEVGASTISIPWSLIRL